jgi:hypothetical protein
MRKIAVVFAVIVGLMAGTLPAGAHDQVRFDGPDTGGYLDISGAGTGHDDDFVYAVVQSHRPFANARLGPSGDLYVDLRTAGFNGYVWVNYTFRLVGTLWKYRPGNDLRVGGIPAVRLNPRTIGVIVRRSKINAVVNRTLWWWASTWEQGLGWDFIPNGDAVVRHWLGGSSANREAGGPKWPLTGHG